MRHIVISGNLVSDSEIKKTINGKDYLYFRFANDEYNEKDKNSNKLTYWFDVFASDNRFLNLKSVLTKGKRIIISGKYSDEIYLDKKTNEPKISRKILCSEIDFD